MVFHQPVKPMGPAGPVRPGGPAGPGRPNDAVDGVPAGRIINVGVIVNPPAVVGDTVKLGVKVGETLAEPFLGTLTVGAFD